LPEANILRGIKHIDQINPRLDDRIEWRNEVKQRWASSMSGRWNVITDQVRLDLQQIGDIVLNNDCKLVVSSDFGWVYTNDLKLIDHLRSVKCLRNKTYSQAVINRPKNTILLKKSPHQQRSYLVNIKLTVQEKETLKGFFKNQQEHIRTSPSFYHWLYGQSYMRTQDYFFIDYSGDQWLTMLSLIRPGLIRKTQQIVTK
jgi:hypothetical protein